MATRAGRVAGLARAAAEGKAANAKCAQAEEGKAERPGPWRDAPADPGKKAAEEKKPASFYRPPRKFIAGERPSVEQGLDL